LAIPGDIENLDPSIPGFFQYAESDIALSKNNCIEIEKISKEKSLNLKTKTYPGTKHGFCLKSNEDDEKDKSIAAEATRDAAEFFSSRL
jgi:dienelactone hydrolase